MDDCNLQMIAVAAYREFGPEDSDPIGACLNNERMTGIVSHFEVGFSAFQTNQAQSLGGLIL
ncbi:hypothetical protein RB25_07325 [Herbaspirillum rubrisubalbicans]|uniref:Uncharacterized protein n=1 Tax=Herbaspirillum rubrisubalbicans TaxID=80842 RepID=A0ABX9C8Z5_9BURK|nr:hypothetical protein RB24_01825 [Herbaspirillum rubrisubalbicans]RAN49068.1 hypothetical protein RB25_07325 [Herbaspirillum rubrisubalbicans]